MSSNRTKTCLLVALVVGCQSGHEESPRAPESASPLGEDTQATTRALVGPEQRILTPADRARFTFRRTGDQFTASHTTHVVTAKLGAVRIEPIHHAEDGAVHGTPLAIETREVRRGATSLSRAHQSSTIDPATGELIITRRGFVEKFENFEGGVEQAWRFDSPPTGDGPLTVRVDIDGHPFVAETQSGLHFSTPGKLGFRYGHATWIDADGVATSVKSRWEDDHIAITVPEDVLVASAYPAVLDPVVEGEITVDEPVVGWTGTGSVRSNVATNGTESLVVWADGRNGSSFDIFGTRLDGTGAVVDAVGIAINTANGVQDNPVVAFAGDYVIAWDDGTNIGAAAVSTGGAVTPLVSPGAGTLPQIAARGTEALVVYRNGTEVRGALYSGGALGSSFAITSGAVAQSVAVAANPAGDYLVAWTDGATAGNLRGQFVTPTGTLSGVAFDISAADGGQNEPAADFNGTNFVVVWSNNSNGVDIYGARVSTTGTVLDTRLENMVTVGGVPVSTAPGTQVQAAVACANTGNCLVTWSDRRTITTTANDVYAQRVDANFAAVGGEIALAALGDEQRNPSVAVSGSDWRVTWHDRRHGGPDTVFTARVGSDGSLPDGTGQNIVGGWNREIRPAIKSSLNNWFVSWSDSRNLGNDVMGVRYSANGVKLDGTARVISNAAGQQGNPTIAFDGTNYFHVWNDTRNGPNQDIYGARMEVTGNVLDTAGLPISTAVGDQLRPSAVFGGGVTLVVWQDTRAGADIYGALVDTTGAVVASDIAICATTGPQVDPAVAFDSTNNTFLVTWADARGGSDDVYAARVTTAGAVQEACGVLVAGGVGNQSAPDISFGAGDFFIVWTDSGVDANGDIRGARVNAGTGVNVIDTVPLTLASGAASQAEPAVAFVDPNIHIVVWAQDNDIYGQTVLSNGLVDGPNYAISANVESESTPAVTAGPSGKPAMVTYERARPDLNTRRVATRRVTFGGTTGTTCGSDAACTSGFCVDGVCCDSACGGNDTTDCQACSVSRGAQINGICSVITDTTHRCRYYADTFCDRIERCDGVNPECPPDIGRREGIACTTSTGDPGVCPANDPSGAPHVCQ